MRCFGSIPLHRNLGLGNNSSLFIANGAAYCSYRGSLRLSTKKQRTDQDHRHLQAKLLKHTNLLSFGARWIPVRDDHVQATIRKVKAEFNYYPIDRCFIRKATLWIKPRSNQLGLLLTRAG